MSQTDSIKTSNRKLDDPKFAKIFGHKENVKIEENLDPESVEVLAEVSSGESRKENWLILFLLKFWVLLFFFALLLLSGFVVYKSLSEQDMEPEDAAFEITGLKFAQNESLIVYVLGGCMGVAFILIVIFYLLSKVIKGKPKMEETQSAQEETQPPQPVLPDQTPKQAKTPKQTFVQPSGQAQTPVQLTQSAIKQPRVPQARSLQENVGVQPSTSTASRVPNPIPPQQ